ncbi:OmpA family protein [Flavitalea flava]
MKKTGIILVLALLVTAGSFAQTSVEFIPTVGYTFASRDNYYDSYSRINDGLNLGASLKFNLTRSFGLEILYSHMNTQSGLYEYGYRGDKLAGSDLKLDYILLGGVQSFGIQNSPVRPFIGGFLGAAILTPGEEAGYNGSSDTKFAVGVQLGTNIYMTPRLGLQLKAQVLSPVDVASGGLYFSNIGSGAGVSTYSSIYQFSLNAGLIMGLGNLLPNDAPRRSYRPGPHHRRYYY